MENKDKEKVYISGQMSGLTKEEYLNHFKKAQKHLINRGYQVVNPSKLSTADGIDYAELLWIDMRTLMKCQAIYMLDNWRKSKGATAEHYFARAIGLKVLYEEEVAN